MDHGLGVGVGLELVAARRKLGLELAVVLDDAVVDDRDVGAHVGVGVALGRAAVGGPARVADAGTTLERLAQETALEVSELALSAPAREVAVLDGRDPSRIVAAIFETAQRVDEVGRDRLRAKYSDDPAHKLNPLVERLTLRTGERRQNSNHTVCHFLTAMLNRPSPCAWPSGRGTWPPTAAAPLARFSRAPRRPPRHPW